MPRRLRRELLALLALAAAVLAAARHLILEPGLALQDPAALRQLLGLAQLQRLLTGQQGWSEAWLGWPVGPGFVQADWQLGPALLAWPMGALGIGFHVQYSALAVAGMLLTAWTCHRLAQAMLGAGPHTLLTGVVGGLAPFLLGLGTPLDLVHGELSVGGTLLLGLGLQRERPWLAGLGGLVLACSAHMGWQQGAYAALLGLAVLSVAGWRRWAAGRTLLAGAAGASLGIAGLLPAALPYLHHGFTHQAGWLASTPWERWLIPLVFLLGVLAARGAQLLAARLPPRWAVVSAAPLLLVVVLPSPSGRDRPAPGIPEIYVGLEAGPPGPLYERFTSLPERCACDAAPRLAAALLHERPLVGGEWAWDHAGLRALEGLAGRFPEARSAELLRILGVAVVIEHAPVSGPPPAGASCQRVHQHRLCALEPLFPDGLPEEHEVQTLGRGPVVGLRWSTPPRAERLELRCEGQQPWRSSTLAWWIVAKLRHGADPPWMDVYLPQPCTTVPEASEGSPLPLYAVSTGGPS